MRRRWRPRRRPANTVNEARNSFVFSWLHPRMSETPAHCGDFISDLNAAHIARAAYCAAGRTFGPGLAAAFAADNFSYAETEARFVDLHDFSAITVALPRPDADRISHRSA